MSGTTRNVLFATLTLAVTASIGGEGKEKNHEAVRIAQVALPDGSRIDVFRQDPKPAAEPGRGMPAGDPAKRTCPGNVAFFAARKTGVVWAAYKTEFEGMNPRLTWAVGAAWDPYRKRTLVAMTESRGLSLDVRLYVCAEKPLSAAPPKFEALRPNTWPKEVEPVAETEVPIAAFRVSSVNVVPLRNGVLLVLEREKHDDPAYARLDASGRWSWLRLAEKPSGKTDDR
jgi:hypothetical protein